MNVRVNLAKWQISHDVTEAKKYSYWIKDAAGSNVWPQQSFEFDPPLPQGKRIALDLRSLRRNGTEPLKEGNYYFQVMTDLDEEAQQPHLFFLSAAQAAELEKSRPAENTAPVAPRVVDASEDPEPAQLPPVPPVPDDLETFEKSVENAMDEAARTLEDMSRKIDTLQALDGKVSNLEQSIPQIVDLQRQLVECQGKLVNNESLWQVALANHGTRSDALEQRHASLESQQAILAANLARLQGKFEADLKALTDSEAKRAEEHRKAMEQASKVPPPITDPALQKRFGEGLRKFTERMKGIQGKLALVLIFLLLALLLYKNWGPVTKLADLGDLKRSLLASTNESRQVFAPPEHAVQEPTPAFKQAAAEEFALVNELRQERDRLSTALSQSQAFVARSVTNNARVIIYGNGNNMVAMDNGKNMFPVEPRPMFIAPPNVTVNVTEERTKYISDTPLVACNNRVVGGGIIYTPTDMNMQYGYSKF